MAWQWLLLLAQGNKSWGMCVLFVSFERSSKDIVSDGSLLIPYNRVPCY